MRLFLQIVGGIWAGVGGINIVLAMLSTASPTMLTSSGLTLNMVLYVIPGLVLVGIGSMLKAQPSYIRRCHQCAEIIQPAAIKCRYCGAVLPPMALPPAVSPRPMQPMKRSTKIALSVAVLGLVLGIVIAGLIANAHRARIQAGASVRQDQISAEIAFLDAQSKLAKKYPGQAKEIRAALMIPIRSEKGPGRGHDASVTGSGSLYHVNIPIGKSVYHCAGPPNEQVCE